MAEKIIFMLLLTGLILLLAYIDKKYNLGLNNYDGDMSQSDWGFGEAKKENSKESKELKQRVEVLERIVTEPSYELNRKINELK